MAINKILSQTDTATSKGVVTIEYDGVRKELHIHCEGITILRVQNVEVDFKLSPDNFKNYVVDKLLYDEDYDILYEE